MDIEKLKILCENVLLDVFEEKKMVKSSYSLNKLEEIELTIKSLISEIVEPPYKINMEILIMTKKFGVYAFKIFENSSLEKSLNILLQELRDQIPGYKNL